MDIKNYTDFLKQRIVSELKAWPASYLFRRPIILFFLFYCLLIFILKGLGVLNAISPRDPSQWAPQTAIITGIVIAPPDLRPKTQCLPS